MDLSVNSHPHCWSVHMRLSMNVKQAVTFLCLAGLHDVNASGAHVPTGMSPLPAGAILVLGRDLVMVPKLIHPLPPTTPRGTKNESDDFDDEQEPPTPHPMTDTWMQVCASAAAGPCDTPICMWCSDSFRPRGVCSAIIVASDSCSALCSEIAPRCPG